MKQLLITTIAAVVLVVYATAPHPKPSTAKAPQIPIDRLAWITGSWQGAVNGGLLEGTWLPPKADTISALVRFTNDGRTEFVEIIKIEKVGNSFQIRLELYDPPMRPQSDKPHVFNLSKIEENKTEIQKGIDGQVTCLPSGILQFTGKSQEFE